MKIIRKKTFTKAFGRLQDNQRKKVDAAIFEFYRNPFSPLLKNHALKGDMQGKRAISAGGDLRIIFTEKDGYVEVLMINVGSHNQVY